MKLGKNVTDKRTIKRFQTLEKEFNEIHNNYYDYSMSVYVNFNTKFKYKCPKHGILEISTHNHLKGKGCVLCYYEKDDKKGFKRKFIERSNKLFKYKYDYSKVHYKNIHTKVIITCPEHGDFLQSPNNHQRGHGCIQCSGTKQRTTKEFIEQSIKIHGDKYDYSNVIYTNLKKKVSITCPIHGEFKQLPGSHLKGRGCEKCSYKLISKVKSFSTKQFIEKSKKVHGNKYNYSKVDFKTMVIDVIIICEEHGEFIQQPFIHSVGSGCPQCSDYGFNIEKKSIFYIRKISVNGKVGLKYGITNQIDGNREKQQIRKMKKFEIFETIYKSKVFENGEKVLELENIIKQDFGKKGYFNKNEMTDGWTETIIYNKKNLDYLKSVIKIQLSESFN